MKKVETIAIILVVLLGIFIWRSSQAPVTSNDNRLETVNFCGTEYQVEKIVINGVDVIRRIAEIASAENQSLCDDIRSADPENLKVELTQRPELDSLHLNGYLFDIDLKQGIIMRPGPHGIEDWVKLK